MTKKQELEEEWSAKYKKSINCNNPKGFSQRAHCQGRKKKMSETIDEGKNKPTNPGLWSRAKSAARSKFKVYPSAYANAWASKWYKKHGGGWRKAGKKKKVNEDVGVFTKVDSLIFKFSKDPKIAAEAEKMNPITNQTYYRANLENFMAAVNKFIATQDKQSLETAEQLAPPLLLASPQGVEAYLQDIIGNSQSNKSTLQEVKFNASSPLFKTALFLALTLAGEGIQIAQQNSQLFSPEAQKVLKDIQQDPEQEEYDNDTSEKDKSGGGSGGGSKPPSNFRVADKQPSAPSPKPPKEKGISDAELKRLVRKRYGRSTARSLGLFESKLLCECSCGCDECGMTADDYLEIDGGMMGSDPYAFDEEFDEYEGNTEDFMNQSKGNPDLNSDGIFDEDELYYHFDLDSDGQVTPDEYESHVEYHAEHPEILDMKKKQIKPIVMRMMESKWR